MNEIQKIAAVVLFKELHSKKKDLYDVLAAFISDIIVEKGISNFTTLEMGEYLIDCFGFDSIPQNVIKTAIKRTNLAKLSDNRFHVIRDSNHNVLRNIGESLDEEIAKNDDIINGAYDYVENKLGVKLSEREKEKVTRSFCAFLLDAKCENEYIAEIASYIISLEGSYAANRIKEITEGVYQYAALTYNEDISKIEKLKNNIVIFLDTEALLSLGGFHGEVHKLYIDEMLQLIGEINEKTHKQCMTIKYMDYVKKEVDDVFNSATYYINGKNHYIRYASESIANGCKTEEDVIAKKANFYVRLKNKGIVEYKFEDRYSDFYNKYNLEGDDGVKELISEEITEKDIEKGSKRVSDINKLRKGIIYTNFEEIKYVFISDNGKAQAINAYFCKQLNCYNFIIGCSKMTNILWLKMNRGLSRAALPSSLEAITRSRVVVSSFTSTKMRKEIDVIDSKIKTGELEREALYEMLEDFKKYASCPDDVTQDSVDINLSYIESEMKTYGEELSLHKSTAKLEMEKRESLTKKLKVLSSTVDKRDELKREKEEKEAELFGLQKKYKTVNKICKVVKVIIGLIFVLFCLFISIQFIQLAPIEWIANRVWLFSCIVQVIILISIFVYGKKTDRAKIIISASHRLEKKIHNKFGVSMDKLASIKNKLEEIEIKLTETENIIEECKTNID